MTEKKRVVITLEGNRIQQENVIHELSKVVDKCNKQPELAATLQTSDVTDEELDELGGFD